MLQVAATFHREASADPACHFSGQQQGFLQTAGEMRVRELIMRLLLREYLHVHVFVCVGIGVHGGELTGFFFFFVDPAGVIVGFFTLQ